MVHDAPPKLVDIPRQKRPVDRFNSTEMASLRCAEMKDNARVAPM